MAAHCTLGTVIEPKLASGQTLIVAATRPKAGRREKNKARVSVRLKIKTPSSSTATQPTSTTPAPPAAPPPALTATYLSATSLDLDGETASGSPTAYFDINTTLNYLTDSGSLLYLVGLPVTYTLVDSVTDGTVTSFSGTTTTGIGAVQGCAIGYSINSAKTTLTLTGESINPETGDPTLPPCLSGTLTVPDADPIALNASFAGNSTYAASTDSQPSL